MSFHAFEDVLALLIYGLVLFPNPNQFIDVNAINIFLTQNPVPTLLRDIMHSLHTRIRKDKELSCVAYRYYPGGLFSTFLNQQ